MYTVVLKVRHKWTQKYTDTRGGSNGIPHSVYAQAPHMAPHVHSQGKAARPESTQMDRRSWHDITCVRPTGCPDTQSVCFTLLCTCPPCCCRWAHNSCATRALRQVQSSEAQRLTYRNTHTIIQYICAVGRRAGRGRQSPSLKCVHACRGICV